MTRPELSPDFLHATRASYDAIAAGYAEWTRDELASKPLERGMLTVFAPGAYALLGFQVGDEPLREAGLGLVSVTRRERETDGPFPERTPQGFVLVRRSVVSGGCEDGGISTAN